MDGKFFDYIKALNKKEYLNKRYSQYHCPHEIGIFLGIPLTYVKMFINKEKENCILLGYWKVYSNEASARKIFKLYDWSKELVMNYCMEGKDVHWIADNIRKLQS